MLLLSGVANADGTLQLRPGMMGVPDLGAIDCATFNRMHPNGPAGMEQAILTWSQGYIYARTGKTIDQLLIELPAGHNWNFDSLTAVAVEYCQKQPNAPLPDAAIAIWTALQASLQP